MRMTNTQLKKIAQSALGNEYGFAPKVSDIILLESYTDGTYILFEVDGHQYRFESYACRFGGVWSYVKKKYKLNVSNFHA